MELRRQLAFFRKEHDEILQFLKEWEGALGQAASADQTTRCKGLAQLVEMEKKLLAINEHCRQEEQSVDSPFQIYLEDAAVRRLRMEHETLDEISAHYRSELEWLTTPPPTNDLVAVGQRLLAQLRRHIAFEEGLLKQIEDGHAAQEKVFLRYTQPAE